MATRSGTLLEKNVETIFHLAGFKTKRNIEMNGYEIDVLAQDSNNRIVIECKQYEKAEINLRNLIHTWDSKNKEINASKIVIALYGIRPKEPELKLAKKYDIIIWDEYQIERYLDLVIKNKADSKLLIEKELGIRESPLQIEEEQTREEEKIEYDTSTFVGKVKAYMQRHAELRRQREEERRKLEEEQERRTREDEALLDKDNMSILRGLSEEVKEEIIDLRLELRREIKKIKEEYAREIERTSDYDSRAGTREERDGAIGEIRAEFLGRIRSLYEGKQQQRGKWIG